MVTVGAVLCLAGAFLPWLHSGSRSRSSFELFDMVARLGFSPDGASAWVLRLWPALPLLLAVSVAMQWWPDTHPPMRRIVSVGAATYPFLVAATMLSAPDIALFRVGVGPLVSVAGAMVMVAGVVVDIVEGKPSASTRY